MAIQGFRIRKRHYQVVKRSVEFQVLVVFLHCFAHISKFNMLINREFQNVISQRVACGKLDLGGGGGGGLK